LLGFLANPAVPKALWIPFALQGGPIDRIPGKDSGDVRPAPSGAGNLFDAAVIWFEGVNIVL